MGLVVFLNANGQQGSRNLMAEYCANNWKVDPVKCADYVPKGYQIQQNQGVEQVQSNTANTANRICPLGSYLGKDSFGNQACLDSKTNQVVNSPNLPSSSNGNSSAIIGIVVFIIIVFIIAAIAKGSRKYKQETYDSQPLKRHGWTEIEKEQVRIRQNGVCNKCGRPPPAWQYHHRDGNRSNNNLSNCEGLCPNCHAVKTHYE